ncbi:DEAD/DEAH box helicase [Leadbetterella byssophila]|uniref:DEAD/DEAH box helicase domain protein n=1 Tax=Leadbetterella byssophila (strain DSM 17132 / JCM 16389 / KACC 11308 / NBRC 106382 / 4M15) TaxID=649349 RepID=E4RRX4_LEAB4|nr:DEAD/DEAH box helicase [Leadbetterella byssophila]ADQ18506.1 DEAD/DEAH box helicase domain protein [Leadbetterella byssophila DSM 17132]
MKFENYRILPEIKRAIADLGYKKPTDIQYKVLPKVLAGEDIMGIAQTGTGKTAAFAIPVLHLLASEKKSKSLRCLVMVPTHELAQQIADVFKSLAKNTRLKIMALYGSTDQEPQIKALQKGVDVLVTTPGRMFDLQAQGHLSLEDIKFLILDEADRMLDLGFYQDIIDVKKRIPKRHQTLFFSATLDEKIKKLAYSTVKNAIRIQISPDDPVSKNIDHSVVMVSMEDKRFFLERMITENPQQKIIVFVRTKVRAERVAAAMARVNIKTVTLHSDKSHIERKAALESFKKGETWVLIATDVSARGVDIPLVEYVINYDLPDVAENYVHRIGRTGRGTQKGKAVSFCSDEELPLLESIEDYLGYTIASQTLSELEYQETLIFSNESSRTFKDVMKEIADFESNTKKRKKK